MQALPTVVGLTSVVAEPGGDDCISVTTAGESPGLAVLVPAPTSLSIRFTKDAELSILLERENVVAPITRNFAATADTKTNVNFAAGNLIAHLSFATDGRMVICGLAPNPG